jgi:TonB family protein
VTRFFSILLLCGGAVFAQVNPAPEGPVYKIGGGVSMPRLISKIEPQYSQEARHLGVDSTVVLSIVVSYDGTPRILKIARGSGFGLDERAKEAVAQWRFQPGMKDEKPVSVYATIEVNFRLLESSSTTARIAYLPEGVAPPIAIKGRLPKYKPPAPSTFHLTFDVSETGEVENLTCAEQAPESILDDIRKIHFQPATSGGQPVRATAKLELTY